MIALPTGVYTLGMAMARQEGFFTAGHRPFLNNNPGDIEWDGPHGFAALHGATHGDGGPHTSMAVFPTLAMGWAAQTGLLLAPARFLHNNPAPLRGLDHGYCNARMEQIIYRYCPPEAPGNSLALTEIYVQHCETWMHCKRSDIITAAMIRGVN